MSTLYPKIWTYWGPRRENTDACAARLARMFEDLRAVHPAFARWYHKGERPSEWNRPFCSTPPRPGELAPIFEKGKSLKVSGEPMLDLGYMIAAWNGQKNDCGVSVRVRAGAWADFRYFANNAVLGLHKRTAANADLETATTLGAALRAIVTAWDADWGRVFDWYYKNPIADPPQGQRPPPFWSGWIVYLATRFAEHVTPPPQAFVETVPGHGVMIYATREIFDLDNPAHVAAADAIQAALAPIQGMVKSRV